MTYWLLRLLRQRLARRVGTTLRQRAHATKALSAVQKKVRERTKKNTSRIKRIDIVAC